MAYIELDKKKIARLRKEVQQFQDDIVCAVGTDFMETIAEAENRMIFDILNGLESEPTADVAEVKHGEWTLETDEEMPNPMFKLVVCSVCNGKANSTYHYCPNCGAKMDKECTT